MKKKISGKGFLVGLLTGLGVVCYKLFKYSGGGSREELPTYIATILSFGILGAILGFLFRRT